MNDYRWFNKSQPQTLQIAVMLGYVEAVLSLFRGWFSVPIMLAIMVAIAVGSFGIANEKKWGYTTRRRRRRRVRPRAARLLGRATRSRTSAS